MSHRETSPPFAEWVYELFRDRAESFKGMLMELIFLQAGYRQAAVVNADRCNMEFALFVAALEIEF